MTGRRCRPGRRPRLRADALAMMPAAEPGTRVHLPAEGEVPCAHPLGSDDGAVSIYDHQVEGSVRGLPRTSLGPVVLERAAGSFGRGRVRPRVAGWHHGRVMHTLGVRRRRSVSGQLGRGHVGDRERHGARAAKQSGPSSRTKARGGCLRTGRRPAARRAAVKKGCHHDPNRPRLRGATRYETSRGQ